MEQFLIWRHLRTVTRTVPDVQTFISVAKWLACIQLHQWYRPWLSDIYINGPVLDIQTFMSVVQFLTSERKFLTCSIDISVVCGTAPNAAFLSVEQFLTCKSLFLRLQILTKKTFTVFKNTDSDTQTFISWLHIFNTLDMSRKFFHDHISCLNRHLFHSYVQTLSWHLFHSCISNAEILFDNSRY